MKFYGKFRPSKKSIVFVSIFLGIFLIFFFDFEFFAKSRKFLAKILHFDDECFISDENRSRLVYVLQRFDEISQKENVSYWLRHGTLLGAKKFQGVIPWDYDADVAVMAEDQEKLRTQFTPKLSEIGIQLIYEQNGSFEMYDRRNSQIFEKFRKIFNPL